MMFQVKYLLNKGTIPSVHFANGFFGVRPVFIHTEGKAGRIPCEPEFAEFSKLGERALQLFLRAVDAQVGDVHAVAVLFLVVAIISVAATTTRTRTTMSAHDVDQLALA